MNRAEYDNKDPLISIVMAVCNQENFVSEAIGSVINQTYKDWELIICDDGSTDKTPAVLNRYKELYPGKIKVLMSDKNYGVSNARNTALKKTTGDYIAFLDSDDWWEREKLDRQLSVFRKSDKIGLVFTSARVVRDNASSDSDRIFLERNFNKFCLLRDLDKKYLIKENNICFSSIMLSKKAMDIISCFNEGLLYQAEDWLLIMKVLYLFNFTCIPEKLVNYRLHKDSYSAKVFLKERMGKEGFKQVYGIAKDFAVKNLFRKSPSPILGRLFFIYLLYYNLYEEDIMSWLQKSVFIKPLRKAKKIAGYFKRLIQNMNLIGAKKLLILFVTSKCNSKCKTCFYWQNLNSKTKDLESKEINNIFNSLPKTLCVLITGGEPFLRGDIEKVLELTTGNKNILSVAINTNGTYPQAIYFIMNKVLAQRKYAKPYHINVSLDGFRDTHNRIRGIDCYDNAILTLNKLEELKKEYKNFFISAVTVISRENIDEIKEFANFIYERMRLSFHYFEIIRGSPSAMDTLQLDKAKLSQLYKDILLIQERYLKRNKLADRDIKKANDKSTHLYRLQFDNFFENKPWDVKCQAGRNTFIIYEDGGFSVCELRKTVLNLKNFNFNIKKILRSGVLKSEIKRADAEKCSCTHGCFILNSIPS